MDFKFITHTSPKKTPMYFLQPISHPNKRRKKREKKKKKVGRLDNKLLMRVKRPPLDRYIFFHQANLLYMQSRIESRIDFALKGAPKGKPRYFNGSELIQQPELLASPSAYITSPTGTNFD
jgi:hypothetical protein